MRALVDATAGAGRALITRRAMRQPLRWRVLMVAAAETSAAEFGTLLKSLCLRQGVKQTDLEFRSSVLLILVIPVARAIPGTLKGLVDICAGFMVLCRLRFQRRTHVLPADEKKSRKRTALSFEVGSKVSVLSVHVRAGVRRCA